MAKRKKLILDHVFYCCKCGNRGLGVVRTIGQSRKPGHLKKLWCLNCQEEVNHVECSPFSTYDFENFLEEFLGDNFTETQERKLPYGLFKDKKIKNKEWNTLEQRVMDYLLEGVE